jgi:hypothetical protein
MFPANHNAQIAASSPARNRPVARRASWRGIRLLALVLTLAVGRAALPQCLDRQASRFVAAVAPTPALGGSVSYAVGNRCTAQANFSMAGHSCALNSGPYTSFTESSSFDLFGSPYSYDHMSFSSGSGYAYVWLYLRTPTTSTTLGISYGGKGFAAILPTIAPKTDSFYAGRLYVSAVYFTIQPTVRFALDPMTSHRATQYSGSANLEVKEGVETTLAYSQRVISFFLPWDLNLSGKVQDIFVNGWSTATSSNYSTAVRGNFSFRDDGANLSLQGTLGGAPFYSVSWTKIPTSVPTVNL